eukprot:578671-Rhodomonas_salina.1
MPCSRTAYLAQVPHVAPNAYHSGPPTAPPTYKISDPLLDGHIPCPIQYRTPHTGYVRSQRRKSHTAELSTTRPFLSRTVSQYRTCRTDTNPALGPQDRRITLHILSHTLSEHHAPRIAQSVSVSQDRESHHTFVSTAHGLVPTACPAHHTAHALTTPSPHPTQCGTPHSACTQPCATYRGSRGVRSSG